MNENESIYEDWIEATCILKDNRVLYVQKNPYNNWDCTVYESNGNESGGGILRVGNAKNTLDYAIKEIGDMLLEIPNIFGEIKEIYDHDRRDVVFKESLNYQKGIRC